MKRIALAGLLLVSVLAASVALSGAVAADTDTGTPTNETVQELRERVETLEDENADLKTKVVSKNGRIQKLEFQIEQQNKDTEFSGGEAQSLKRIGAWNPYKNETTFLIFVESENGGLYQFVGPGNGEHSFNGMSAWTRVLGGDATLFGNVTVDLEYAPAGINETQVYPATRAQTEIRSLMNKMNQPRTRVAWEQWNNERRHDAETKDSWSMLMIGGISLLGMFGAAWAESKRHFLFNRRRENNRMEHYGFLQGEQPSRWSRLKDRFFGGR